ncbi:MAG: hypothetical protein ACRDJI_09115, partial [Actinomycetota bacterium]
GEAPMKPSERAAWHEAVRAIETYRQRWGVEDAGRALGDEPMRDEQRVEREIVERRVEDLAETTYEAEIDVRERSIEL